MVILLTFTNTDHINVLCSFNLVGSRNNLLTWFLYRKNNLTFRKGRDDFVKTAPIVM